MAKPTKVVLACPEHGVRAVVPPHEHTCLRSGCLVDCTTPACALPDGEPCSPECIECQELDEQDAEEDE